MGITDKIYHFAESTKAGAQNSLFATFHFVLRLITGFFLGLTCGLIFQEFIGFGFISLFFIIIVFMGIFLKILSSWSMGKILIFDLFCILIGMLLRMYILMAP